MKVLVIGATGNVGVRLVAALLSHNHHVTAYVRSTSKLQTLLPESTFSRIATIQGNATDVFAIKSAILTSSVDAVVNCAGLAAMAPWNSSDFPAIFAAVLDAVVAAGDERGAPLRAWFLGGMTVLNLPGSATAAVLSDYVPIFLEHRQNVARVRALPAGKVDWSLLCPSHMTPESEDFSVPTKSSSAALVGAAGVPPNWNDSWIRSIPFLGPFLVVGMNAPRYITTLEQNVEFIAKDLENRDSRYIGTTVGVIDPAK